MATKRDELRQIVDSVVLAQGNDYIKELLREKQIRIGVTKDDFQRNLYDAIDRGILRRDDVLAWIQAVEGWGAHHVHLFLCDPKALERRLWGSTSLKKRLEAADLGHLLSKPKPFAFPRTLTATSARRDELRFEITWHVAGDSWVRARDRDRQETIEGDLYRLDAFRFRPERAVIRLAARRDFSLCGVFIPLPLGEDHVHALREVIGTADRIFGRGVLEPVNIAQAQLRLDLRQLDGPVPFRAARSRVTGQGSYIEFGSVVADGGYADVDAVRQVRRAVGNELTGDSAGLAFEVHRDKSEPRAVRVDLNGPDRRIYIRAQLTEEQEWQILQEISS